MGLPKPPLGPDRDEDEDVEVTADGSMYWCTDCGMMFERSSPDIDYAWCTRCGADTVRELPWPSPP